MNSIHSFLAKYVLALIVPSGIVPSMCMNR
jgi:hypothetical protein